MHLNRTHGLFLKKKIANNTPRNNSENSRGKFICTNIICKAECDNYDKYIKHLKSHLRIKEEIRCPYNNCAMKYKILSSYTSHVSKQHSNHDNTMEFREIVHEVNPNDDMPLFYAMNCIDDQDLENYESSVPPKPELMNQEVDKQKSFLINKAQFFLKL